MAPRVDFSLYYATIKPVGCQEVNIYVELCTNKTSKRSASVYKHKSVCVSVCETSEGKLFPGLIFAHRHGDFISTCERDTSDCPHPGGQTLR